MRGGSSATPLGLGAPEPHATDGHPRELPHVDQCGHLVRRGGGGDDRGAKLFSGSALGGAGAQVCRCDLLGSSGDGEGEDTGGEELKVTRKVVRVL